jgi:hypothetical protein
MRAVLLIAAAAAVFGQANDPARAELERIRGLVEAGALPRKALDQALESVEQAEDESTLRATLYGHMGLEEMTDAQSAAMVAAAERQWKRRQAVVAEAEELVRLEVRPRNSLVALMEGEQVAKAALDAARLRAALFRDLAAMAHAEQELESRLDEEPRDAPRIAEVFSGDSGVPSTAKLRAVEAAFEREFGHTLPITARGETALHRSMGFDHTGRMDVGLEPDSREGAWLRKLLETLRVPHLVFRGAVRGQSTAAHIHIGPPSHRIKKAD